MSFRSPNRTPCLNPMRYYSASIKNTYCHQPPSIVSQSIGIYDHFRVLPIGQSLPLILTQTQYSLKVESLCNIVVYWIMTIDSLASWFIIGPIQCASHTLVHSPWETHLDGQDKSFLQLRGDVPKSLLDCPNPSIDYGQLIYLQGTHDLYFLCNS